MECGIKVSHDTVWVCLKAEGLSSKKTVLPQEQQRPKIARFRARWKAHQHRIDPRRLVFVMLKACLRHDDETWIKTNMTRLRGWSKRGMPLKSKVPYGHWKTLTFMAGLRLDQIDAHHVEDMLAA